MSYVAKVNKLLAAIKRILIHPRTSSLIIYILFEPLLWIIRQRKYSSNINKWEKILVVRVDQIGDFVLTSSFLRELRYNKPLARIVIVVSPEAYSLAEKCPYVNAVYIFDRNVSGGMIYWKRHLRAITFSIKHLWKERFDVAIAPRWDIDYYCATYISYLSGAGTRVGYSEHVNIRKSIANAGFDRLLNIIVKDESLKHEALRSTYLLQYLHGKVRSEKVELWLDPEDIRKAQISLQLIPSDCRRICIAPGAFHLKRCWSKENYARLSRKLIEEQNTFIIILGGMKEIDIGNYIKDVVQDSCINLCGKTTLRETAAIIAGSELVVGNDSGIGHISAAFDKKIVIINGTSMNGDPLSHGSPLRFSPWTKIVKIVQPEFALPPCNDVCEQDYAHCINQISVDDVFCAIKELLDEK